MLRSIAISICFLPLWLWAQHSHDSIYYKKEKNHPGVIGAANFKDIYLRLADTFYGGFGADTQCGMVKYIISGAKTDGNIQHHLLQGRSWHYGIENRFLIKPKIISIVRIRMEECVDTFYTTPKALQTMDSMVKRGWEIHFVEGNYTLKEDTTGKFAGAAEGVFKIMFLYHPIGNTIVSIPKSVLLQEPSVIFTGLWNPKNRNDINAPQFFCSLIPYINEKREVLLPDFRLKADGQVQPEKWISLKTKPPGIPR
jgi:hypothetical protein